VHDARQTLEQADRQKDHRHRYRGGTPRQRAESEYKSAYQNLWRSAQIAEVAAVLSALARFQRAAVALSLTKPEAVATLVNSAGAGPTVNGWAGRPPAVLADPCPVCGGPVRVKPLEQTGPQRQFCSDKCMRAGVARRARDRRRGHGVQPAQLEAVPVPNVAPLDSPCDHEFKVLPASELAARRAADGWPAWYGKYGWSRDTPHLVCVRCLRTYHGLKHARITGGRLPASTALAIVPKQPPPTVCECGNPIEQPKHGRKLLCCTTCAEAEAMTATMW
jgi:endogenous inhibitor of DNA gyrase (YacG/DUF329 family)